MVDELPRDRATLVVVMKSTVPVGTGDEGAPPARRARPRARRLRLEPGVHGRGHRGARLHAADRIVVGAFRDEDGDAVAALHDGIDAPIVRCDVASAEMIKLAANAAL